MTELWVTSVICSTVVICICTVVGAYQKIALKRCDLWERDLDQDARKLSLAEREEERQFRESVDDEM